MLRTSWPLAVAVTSFVAIACSAQAHAAYQTAQIGPSGATLFAKPKSGGAGKAKLSAGSIVNVVVPAENGFYKTTTAKGQTGWVLEGAVAIAKPQASAPIPPPAQAATSPAAPAAPSSVPKADASKNSVSVGALMGVGVAGGGTSFSFGLDLIYRPSPEWSGGMYFSYLNLQSATGVTSTSGTATTVVGASLMLIAPELNYHVPQVPEIHFGAKLGMGIASEATGVTSVDAAGNPVTGSVVAFAGAVAAGYDYPLTSTLSLGLESNFFYVMGDIATTVFNGFGVFRYNF